MPINFLRAGIFFSLSFTAHAQFSPGPNPITTSVGAQTLSSGNGTIEVGGAISVNATSAALAMTGTSNLTVNGTIQQAGSGRGIDSNSGTANLSVVNNGVILTASGDAFRINTSGSSVSLTNNGSISVTAGGQAIDWAAITSGANVLTNLAGATISAVGEDAVRPGQNGVVNNSGNITATPTGTTTVSGSDAIDLRTQKTVVVTNSGLISGRHGIATDGANVGPSSLTVNNTAGGMIQALNGSGINLDGVNTTVVGNVTNSLGATIKGGLLASTDEGDGDGIDVDGVLTLVNSGDVLGLGAKGGTNNAEGIAAGGGSITNTATGQIIGSTDIIDAPNGNATRSGNGILIDDSNGGNAVAALTVLNDGLIRGKTGFAIRTVGTFADTITNNATGTIRGAGIGAAIQTGGGNDTLTNSGTILSDTGNAVDLEDGDDTLTIQGGSASITGNVSGGTGSNTLNINPGTSNNFTYGGSFSNFSGVNIQSGTISLSGVNAYTGDTNVNGGRLLVNGSLAAGSSVSVSSGAALGGSGTVGGTVEILAGGKISPGTSIESLDTGSEIWYSEGIMEFEFSTDGSSGGAGAEWDLLAIAGTLDLSGITTPFVMELVTMTNATTPGSLGAWDPLTNHTWEGFVTTSGGVVGFADDKFAFDTSGFQDSLNVGSYFTVQQNGNNLDLLYVVPEPSTMVLMFGAAAGLLGLRRRRN